MEKVLSKSKSKSKWRFIWVIPILILTAASIPKILQLPSMVDNMTNMGIGHMVLPVGILELACVIVFLIPSTRKIGFLLLVAYVGGIIAIEWSAGEFPVPGIVVQLLLWTGMYFEEPAFFSPPLPNK